MYDLMFFYAAMLALVPIVMRLPPASRAVALAIFASIIARPFLRLPILALITMGMLRFVGGTLYSSLSFVPNWRLLLGYGLYFGFGWLLYLRRDLIHGFDRLAWTQTLMGVALFFVVGATLRLLPVGTIPRPMPFILYMSMQATVVWLLFFGLTGLYIRHLNRPSPVIRYIVDSSY
jgi:glucan biosynthesis protein C